VPGALVKILMILVSLNLKLWGCLIRFFSCGPTSSWDLSFSLFDLYCYFHWPIHDAPFVFLGLN
jgi:hypothetical protein